MSQFLNKLEDLFEIKLRGYNSLRGFYEYSVLSIQGLDSRYEHRHDYFDSNPLTPKCCEIHRFLSIYKWMIENA